MKTITTCIIIIITMLLILVWIQIWTMLWMLCTSQIYSWLPILPNRCVYLTHIMQEAQSNNRIPVIYNWKRHRAIFCQAKIHVLPLNTKTTPYILPNTPWHPTYLYVFNSPGTPLLLNSSVGSPITVAIYALLRLTKKHFCIVSII